MFVEEISRDGTLFHNYHIISHSQLEIVGAYLQKYVVFFFKTALLRYNDLQKTVLLNVYNWMSLNICKYP